MEGFPNGAQPATLDGLRADTIQSIKVSKNRGYCSKSEDAIPAGERSSHDALGRVAISYRASSASQRRRIEELSPIAITCAEPDAHLSSP